MNQCNLVAKYLGKSDNTEVNPSLCKLVTNTIFGQFYGCDSVIRQLEEYEMENQIRYDLIVRYRFDIFSSGKIDFDKYDHNYIHGIKRGCCYPDWIFFGKNEIMKDFMKIYTKILCGKINGKKIPEDIFIESANNNILFDIPDTFTLNKHGYIQC